MGYVILNGEVLAESDVKLGISNRAFRYGDAIFETMTSSDSKIRHIDLHWERLENALKLLQMKYLQVINKEVIIRDFAALKLKNELLGDARIRLQVFRSGDGLYTPKTNQIGYLLEVTKLASPYGIYPSNDKKCHVGFCDSIKLSYSAISSLKTCNSIPYVLAALERDEKKLDDIILLNENECLSECSSSNLFWWDGNSIFTPSIHSGCIAGVMRKVLIEHFTIQGIAIKEGLFLKESLTSAKAMFTSNCTGIKLVSSVQVTPISRLEFDNDTFINSQVFSSIRSLF